MSAEVAEAIRQTRRTLAEKTWVPHFPNRDSAECCLATAIPTRALGMYGPGTLRHALKDQLEWQDLVAWNDRQTDVGAVLGMTLQALIAELCKPTLAPPE